MSENVEEKILEEEPRQPRTKLKKKTKCALIITISIFLAITIIAISLWVIQEHSLKKNYTLAVEKYDAGSYTEALDIFSTLLKYADSSAYFTDCQYQLAILDFENGEYSKAIETFTELESYKDSAGYLTEYAYRMAVADFENSEYSKAIEAFTTLGDYKDSANYLTEYAYRMAVADFENSKYSKAIEAFTTLGDYKDSAELLQKAVFERKYASYNINVDIDPLYFEEAGIKTAEEVETEMSALLYGEWYAEETGEKMSVNSEQINARSYGINYATHTGGTIVVNFYYLDEPEKTYNIANTGLWFDYIDMRVSALRITLNDPDIYEESLFYSITAEEYNTLVEQDAQAAAKQQRYSNEAVIQKAFSVFKNRIGGNYSGAGKLYHSSSYSDANVVYRWESKTYVCTFIGKYTTNIFDVFGTSTKTYFVSAEYRDTGSDLMMLSFDIS